MRDLKEKLARRAGFKVLGRVLPSVSASMWCDIDMTGFAVFPGEDAARGLPNFPEDLNACFVWLVPKMKIEAVKFVPVTNGQDVIVAYGCTLTPEGWGETKTTIEETPALALCRAIEQLIDTEQPTQPANDAT